MNSWDLVINTTPLPGTTNMAVDEYLFLSLPATPHTVLRFYTWRVPTVSLGRGQDIARALDLDACRQLGVEVVRRITGGKLVLHHQEITYSLCSNDLSIFPDTLSGSYRLISLGLMEGLKALGLLPELASSTEKSYSRGSLPCFAQPAQNEVTVGGRKIIGSAQRRWGSRFLQHGSIPLKPQGDLLRRITRLEATAVPLKMTSLEEALGRPVSFAEALPFFVAGIAGFFQVALRPRTLSKEEWGKIEIIERQRYASLSWTMGQAD